nr:CMF_HP1_G0048200.mRNA.1.CDS.1 [Saccharomyces cerevisiae]
MYIVDRGRSRSSSRGAAAAPFSLSTSKACSPRGSSDGLPPALSSDNEIVETVPNVSAPVVADPTRPSLFQSNYTAASCLTSVLTSPSQLHLF